MFKYIPFVMLCHIAASVCHISVSVLMLVVKGTYKGTYRGSWFENDDNWTSEFLVNFNFKRT